MISILTIMYVNFVKFKIKNFHVFATVGKFMDFS